MIGFAIVLLAGSFRPLAAPADISIALVGDLIIVDSLAAAEDPGFLILREEIRAADVAVANLESLFHDWESPPSHRSGGTYVRADPAIARELSGMGFDLLARANNHAGDYGVGGMRSTTRALAEAGIKSAGVGESLSESRLPAVVSRHGTDVALVAATTSFPDHSRAANGVGMILPRPGVNPLRLNQVFRLSPARWMQMQALLREIGHPVSPMEKHFRWRGARFEMGRTGSRFFEVHEEDARALEEAVKAAAAVSDIVLVSLHCHESDDDRLQPPQAIRGLVSKLISAGAQVVFVHGPHHLRGVEVFDRGVALYGLGTLVNHILKSDCQPPDAFESAGLSRGATIQDFNAKLWHEAYFDEPGGEEALLAVGRFRNRVLQQMELWPVVVDAENGTGLPRRAEGADADRILDRITILSRPFGTEAERFAGIARLILRK